MTPAAIGALVGLGFAAVWLWAGASALSRRGAAIAVGIGAALIGAAVVRQLTGGSGGGGRFDGRVYGIAVGAEIVAVVAAAVLLGRIGRRDLMLPAVGAIVGAHFIGLYLATGATVFVWLAVGLVALNLVALFLPRRRPRIVSGLGSAALLVAAALA